MVWGTLLQNYSRLYGSLTMFQESHLDPCSTLENQTWSNNHNLNMTYYMAVSVSQNNIKQVYLWLLQSNLFTIEKLPTNRLYSNKWVIITIGHLHWEVMWHRFYENESYMILP